MEPGLSITVATVEPAGNSRSRVRFPRADRRCENRRTCTRNCQVGDAAVGAQRRDCLELRSAILWIDRIGVVDLDHALALDRTGPAGFGIGQNSLLHGLAADRFRPIEAAGLKVARGQLAIAIGEIVVLGRAKDVQPAVERQVRSGPLGTLGPVSAAARPELNR